MELRHSTILIDPKKFEVLAQESGVTIAFEDRYPGDLRLRTTAFLVNSPEHGLNLLTVSPEISGIERDRALEAFERAVDRALDGALNTPLAVLRELADRGYGRLSAEAYRPDLFNQASTDSLDLVLDHPLIGKTLELKELLIADPQHFKHQIFDQEGNHPIYPEFTQKGPELISEKITDPSGQSATVFLDANSGQALAVCAYGLGGDYSAGLSSTNSRFLEVVKNDFAKAESAKDSFPTMVEFWSTSSGEILRIVLHPNRFPLYAEALSKAQCTELEERHIAEQLKKIDLKALLASDSEVFSSEMLSKGKVISRDPGPNLRVVSCRDHADEPFTAYRLDDGTWLGIRTGQSVSEDALVTQNPITIGKIAGLAHSASQASRPRESKTEKVRLTLENGREVEALLDQNYGYLLCAKALD